MAQHHTAFLTAFAADNSAGTSAWSDPSNAAASVGPYATVAFSGSAGEGATIGGTREPIRRHVRMMRRGPRGRVG